MRFQAFRLAAMLGVLAAGSPTSALADVEEAVAALRAGDVDGAIALLEPEAEAGDADAQYQLAALLASRPGDLRDVPQAIVWLTQAVAQDHAPALLLSGRFYEIGLGAPQDFELARQAYAAAAEAGLPAAERLLEWDACWQDPSADCLLEIIEHQLFGDRFRDPVVGRTVISVINARVTAGDLDRALELIGVADELPLDIEQTQRLVDAIIEAAAALAAADRVDDAAALVDAFAEPIARIIPSVRIAAVLEGDAAEPFVEQAIAAAETLPSGIAQASGLIRAAETAREAGDPELAARLAAMAVDAVPEPNVDTLTETNQVRARIAGTMGRLGDVEVPAALARAADVAGPQVWQAAINAFIDAGETGAAVNLLADVPDDAVRADAAVALLEAAAQGEDAPTLPAVVTEIAALESPLDRSQLAARIAVVAGRDGDLSAVTSAMDLIDLPMARLQALDHAQAVMTDPQGIAAAAVAAGRAVGLSAATLDPLVEPADAAAVTALTEALLAGGQAPLFTEGPLVDEAYRRAAQVLARAGAGDAVAEALGQIGGDDRAFFARLAVVDAVGLVDAPLAADQITAAEAYAAPDGEPFRARALARLGGQLAALGAEESAIATLRRIEDPTVFAGAALNLITQLDASAE